MVKEKQQDKEIERIPMSIVNDGKQLSIRIPSKFVEALQIDTGRDVFLFEFDKKDLSLRGLLINKEDIKKIE